MRRDSPTAQPGTDLWQTRHTYLTQEKLLEKV
jgi:hypothetical protein